VKKCVVHTEGRDKHNRCITCHKAAKRRWTAQAHVKQYNRDYGREWRRRKQIEKAGYAPTVCESCGGPTRKGHQMSWDHDHKTGKFRGWLCHSCNAALGLLKDDPERIAKLLNYIERVK
jgi:hypothetical protein